jgi:acetylornithine deacetylase/succinyl-diaminopimelate desuccinylase-like protein
MTYVEIHVEGPHDGLHSGFYGGAVHNPALALVEILDKMFNDDHSIAVPGFYDDVVPLSDAERAEVAKTDMSEAELLAATGVPAPWGVADFTIRERVSARPTLEINGLSSGWTGPGPKTIIPATAMAKVSCRLVGNQDPHDIYEKIAAYVASLAPPTVKVRVDLLTTGEPALIDFTLPEMQAAARAYETGWGARPVFTRGGGSIPIVADINHLLDMPVVMMGYGLDTDGLHGTNEHYRLEMFGRGIETAIVYLDELAALPG